MDSNGYFDDRGKTRLYIGNLDFRITEASLIKLFARFGKIVSDDFLWHTRGRMHGEPRGFAFIQYSSKEEAILAEEKMHGRLACGWPLIVRLASKKLMVETAENHSKVTSIEASKTGPTGSSSCGWMNRSAKIAAIKNKLKALEEESPCLKKQKQGD